MPSLRPRRLVRPPRQKRELLPPELHRDRGLIPPPSLTGQFTKITESVVLKRRPGPDSVIAPESLATIGDLIFVHGHDFPCEVVAKSREFILCLSKRTGGGFSVPLTIKVELLNP